QQRVDALGRGGYRRYDESTATRLDDAAALLIDRWAGDLRRLRDEGEADSSRLSSLLQAFTGIGPTGAHVFLREVQAVWPQVRPHVDPLVREGAEAAELPEDAQALAGLVDDDEIAALAAALVRVARDPSLMDDLDSWADRRLRAGQESAGGGSHRRGLRRRLGPAHDNQLDTATPGAGAPGP